MSVAEGHDLMDRIEEAMRTVLAGVEVTVHIEPIEDPGAWNDSDMLPVEREVLGHDPPRSGEKQSLPNEERSEASSQGRETFPR